MTAESSDEHRITLSFGYLFLNFSTKDVLSPSERLKSAISTLGSMPSFSSLSISSSTFLKLVTIL
ncbi:MAG: hypothetical protein QXO35_01280 [Candidatus Micrarchaeia archaeon]